MADRRASASRSPRCSRTRARRRSCAPGWSTSLPPATSRRASSACPTTSLSQLRRPRPPVRRLERVRGAGVLGRAAALVLPDRGLRRVSRLFQRRRRATYARRLRRRGYDAAVGGVAAYSTLGQFKDPVLNTMLGWSDAQLAATLFHELAHQVVYVPGDSEFNEAFATVVEEAGLERWLAARSAAAGSGGVARTARAAVRSSSRCC